MLQFEKLEQFVDGQLHQLMQSDDPVHIAQWTAYKEVQEKIQELKEVPDYVQCMSGVNQMNSINPEQQEM
jgi:hypothetical protein